MADESILVVGVSGSSSDAEDALSSSFKVSLAETLSAAQEKLATAHHHVVVVDADLEGQADAPWRLVEALRDSDAGVAIVLMVTPDTPWTSFASYRQRPAALVSKPVDRTGLLMAVDSALVYRRLLEENRTLKRQLGSAVSLGDWVGCTPESAEVRKSIATGALATVSVLLIGEKGTGRRLAAELLHRHGRNPGSTFLPIDLTSVPKGELGRMLDEAAEASDSDRSGYVRGARPGALYLGELTALDAEDQERLRRFLERPLPFRVIASATPDIADALRLGRFDEGTYRAASRISIKIPALRERRGDIPLLIDHFLKRFCEKFELKPLGIPSSAIENYSNYDWPGNVAELSMLIGRAVSIASAAKFDGTTLPEHFCAPPSLTVPEPGRLKNVSLRELIADIEKRIILQTLERVDGSQKRAAEELRLNPTTLHEKMKRYKILPQARRRA